MGVKMVTKVVAGHLPTLPDELKVFDKAAALTVEIDRLTAERTALFDALAERTCPYKAGQVIVTETGLGKYGLKIDKVVGPKNPTTTNRWALETFALTKAGEESRRAVMLEEENQWCGAMRVK